MIFILILDNLHDIEIQVAITPDDLDSEYSVCFSDDSQFNTGQAKTLTCDNVKVGRYVRLQIMSTAEEYLEVAELRVRGF